MMPTGYGRVTYEVLSRLHRDGYQVHCLGRGYDGWPYSRECYPYSILPTGQEFWGSQSLGKAIEHVKPDFLVALGDLWMIRWIKTVKQRNGTFVVAYIPIDGGPLPVSAREEYKQFDKVVTASQFGREQLAALIPGSAVDVIHHGVDADVFRPLTHAPLLKQRDKLEGKFVVGCVARNQMRKQFPCLFEAFTRFHAEHRDSVLYLHT
jgi:glycosyltransferase involved in cell wall biosynthesis